VLLSYIKGNAADPNRFSGFIKQRGYVGFNPNNAFIPGNPTEFQKRWRTAGKDCIRFSFDPFSIVFMNEVECEVRSRYPFLFRVTQRLFDMITDERRPSLMSNWI